LKPNDGVFSIAWSPNGQSMAYATSRELYLTDRAGKAQKALYTGDIDPDQIAWSPDSQWVAFASHPPIGNNGSTEIILCRVADVTIRVLTHSPARDYSPTWSPDGKQIAFVSNREGSSKIYVMNTDGTDQHRLTNEAGEELSPTWSQEDQFTIFTGTDVESTPTPLQSGQFIVFSANYDSTYQLYIREVPSGIIHQFTAHGIRNSTPRFSPNKQIAFVSYRDGNDEIYVLDASQGWPALKRVTKNQSENYSPTWVR
jgi:TolB protein